jgi:hypothetical protein
MGGNRMSADSRQNDVPSEPAPPDCPLPTGQQTRNLVLFGINVGLIYLAAPVLYVGITQAALCEKLEADKTVSNWPSAVYSLTTPFPILVAWYFPFVRSLRPVMAACYLIAAVAGAFVVVSLLLPTPDGVASFLEALTRRIHLRFPPNWVIPAINVHAAVLGCTLGVTNTFAWEVLGRGVSAQRRGQAFALAFGVGPLLAVLGSLTSQVILGGADIEGIWGRRLVIEVSYPWNFALLFGSSVPAMALAAYLSTKFIVPLPAVELRRQPFFRGVFGGLGDFLSNRLILVAALAYILVASGYAIITNLALYTDIATGQPAVKFAGYQNTLRFGFKVVAGLFLGWWLTRTSPKAGMLLTGLFCLMSVSWALVAPGTWFLLSFGLMGAGELMGVYYPNYIFSCSTKAKMRRNMAFSSMLFWFSWWAPGLYGQIADRMGAAGSPPVLAASMIGYSPLGMPEGQGLFFTVASSIVGRMARKFGFQCSFWVSIALLVAALLLVLLVLPARPRPRETDTDASDQAPETATKDAAESAKT